MIEESIAKEMSRQIAEEIDWEILCDILVSVGWRKIKLSVAWSSMTSDFQYEVKAWLSKNIKGHYKGRGREWLFENEKDAILFALRWS